MSQPLPKLSKIILGDDPNPVDLMQNWAQAATENNANSGLMALATSDKQGRVSNRTVVIRDIVDGNLIVLTTTLGQKYKDITENPRAAATILFCYKTGEGNLQRQIRIEGAVEILPAETCRTYFEKDRIHGKIRSIVCTQGEETTWGELKERHDQLLHDVVENKVTLSMADSAVAFQLVPNRYDFYHGYDTAVADRILFTKDDHNIWNYKRIQA